LDGKEGKMRRRERYLEAVIQGSQRQRLKKWVRQVRPYGRKIGQWERYLNGQGVIPRVLHNGRHIILLEHDRVLAMHKALSAPHVAQMRSGSRTGGKSTTYVVAGGGEEEGDIVGHSKGQRRDAICHAHQVATFRTHVVL
jgi:hypothetical protein